MKNSLHLYDLIIFAFILRVAVERLCLLKSPHAAQIHDIGYKPATTTPIGLDDGVREGYGDGELGDGLLEAHHTPIY